MKIWWSTRPVRAPRHCKSDAAARLTWSCSTSAYQTSRGRKWRAKLRAGSDVPIIMLTAKSEERDRIAGLELGADNYVTEALQPPRARLEVSSRAAQGTLSG